MNIKKISHQSMWKFLHGVLYMLKNPYVTPTSNTSAWVKNWKKYREMFSTNWLLRNCNSLHWIISHILFVFVQWSILRCIKAFFMWSHSYSKRFQWRRKVLLVYKLLYFSIYVLDRYCIEFGIFHTGVPKISWDWLCNCFGNVLEMS